MSDSNTPPAAAVDLTNVATDLNAVAGAAEDTAKVITEADTAVADVQAETTKVVDSAEADVAKVESKVEGAVTDVKDLVLPPAATATQPAPASSVVTKLPPVPEAPAPEAVALTPQQIAESRALSIIQELLGEYKKIRNQTIQNAKSFQAGAQYLANIFQRVLDQHTPAILDEVWNFFVEHADGILSRSVALSGMESVKADIRQRVELAYKLFHMAVTKKTNVADPAAVNQTALKTIVKSPGIIVYLENKVKSIF